MTLPTEPVRGRAAAVILMSVTLIWSVLLAVGFGWVAATAADSMGPGRRLAFAAVSVFLTILAVRTAYELWRRLTKKDLA